MSRATALRELVLVRIKEFIREPEALFWVYGFPVVLMVVLGLAFGRSAKEELRVALVRDAGSSGESGEDDASVEAALREHGVTLERLGKEEALARYSDGELDLVLEPVGDTFRFSYDPDRPRAELASLKVERILQDRAGRSDPVAIERSREEVAEVSYLEWLIPGILGMNIMSGGMWGLGFVTVDLRMRKLLKRFVATPMRRSDFLLALVISRLAFLVTEVGAILAIGCFGFGLEIRGGLLELVLLSLAGAFSFAGLGLLTACRTEKLEVISGLLNFVMMPMWLCSGIFFSAERFPAVLQPFIQALPLTQLNNGLRAIILDGEGLLSQWLPLTALMVMGVVCFAAAVRWFRWN